MKKKLLVVLMSALVLTTAVGCGDSKKQKGKTTADTSVAVEESSELTDETAAEVPADAEDGISDGSDTSEDSNGPGSDSGDNVDYSGGPGSIEGEGEVAVGPGPGDEGVVEETTKECVTVAAASDNQIVGEWKGTTNTDLTMSVTVNNGKYSVKIIEKDGDREKYMWVFDAGYSEAEGKYVYNNCSKKENLNTSAGATNYDDISREISGTITITDGILNWSDQNEIDASFSK